MKTPVIEILIDARNGQYIPQMFAELEGWLGISESDRSILREGPDCEFYWEAWDRVLDGAFYVIEGGPIYRLHHDGDLFAYRYHHNDREAEQLREFFGEE